MQASTWQPRGTETAQRPGWPDTSPPGYPNPVKNPPPGIDNPPWPPPIMDPPPEHLPPDIEDPPYPPNQPW